MRYVNASKVLPEALVDQIKKYVEGMYIYIPQGENKRRKWGSDTHALRDLDQRNMAIYEAYLWGHSYEHIGQNHFLSVKSIRRIVLKISREMAVKGQALEGLLDHWHLSGVLVAAGRSSWSIEDKYLLTAYKSHHKLQRHVNVLKTLDHAQVRVAKLVPLADKRLYLQVDDVYYVLTTKLKGKAMTSLDKCDHDMKDLGRLIGSLHVAFKLCQEKMSYWHNSLLEEMQGWVSQELNLRQGQDKFSVDAQAVIDSLEEIYSTLDQQLIHRNIHMGNFLFDKGKFSGYDNFDWSQSNIRIFDICYFIMGTLSQSTPFDLSDYEWLHALKDLVEGYHSVMTISREERRAIPCVCMAIELLFVAYFRDQGNQVAADEAQRLFYYVKDKIPQINIYLRSGD